MTIYFIDKERGHSLTFQCPTHSYSLFKNNKTKAGNKLVKLKKKTSLKQSTILFNSAFLNVYHINVLWIQIPEFSRKQIKGHAEFWDARLEGIKLGETTFAEYVLHESNLSEGNINNNLKRSLLYLSVSVQRLVVFKLKPSWWNGFKMPYRLRELTYSLCIPFPW